MHTGSSRRRSPRRFRGWWRGSWSAHLRERLAPGDLHEHALPRLTNLDPHLPVVGHLLQQEVIPALHVDVAELEQAGLGAGRLVLARLHLVTDLVGAVAETRRQTQPGPERGRERPSRTAR